MELLALLAFVAFLYAALPEPDWEETDTEVQGQLLLPNGRSL